MFKRYPNQVSKIVSMYRDILMSQRLERIGELLAKGVYLYLKRGKLVSKNEQLIKIKLIDSRRNKKIDKF